MDMAPWITGVGEVVATHRLGPGQYARWLWQDEKSSRELGLNPYGCADAANILYTIGDFFLAGQERRRFIETLGAMQSPEDGLYRESTHHPIHTTAHCVAALELFDALPPRRLSGLDPYRSIPAMESLLEGLAWRENPWPASHQGAGLYAALAITRTLDKAWEAAYFAWLAQNANLDYGMGLQNRVDLEAAPLAHQLFGWFHYLFNHVHAREPFPHAPALIDTCLSLYRQDALTPGFGRSIGFREIDWVFSLHRASRQTDHRFAECRQALADFAEVFCPYLLSLDMATHDPANDLHMLFGALCAVAELQQALPGAIKTAVPLKLVLDRRPFI